MGLSDKALRHGKAALLEYIVSHHYNDVVLLYSLLLFIGRY